MALVQTIAPTIEPVTVADVHVHSRVIDSTEDTLIALMISAARQYAEMFTGRSFITQQWRLTLDAFATTQNYGLIELDRGIVRSVDSITYTAMDGSTGNLASAANYVADLSALPARLTPRFGQIWPIPLPQIGAVQITYTAGYGDQATDVPEGIRHWILMRVATIFENREGVAILNRGKVQELPFVDTLLDPFCIVTA